MKTFKHFVSFTLFVLVGCRPAFLFKFANTNRQIINEFEIISDSIRVEFLGAHPWLEKSGKKTVIINGNVSNIKKLETSIFSTAIFKMTSKIDTFSLNNESIRKDTFILKPGENRKISLSFTGSINYTLSKYKESVEKDTLKVERIYSPDVFYLIGNRRWKLPL